MAQGQAGGLYFPFIAARLRENCYQTNPAMLTPIPTIC